MYKRNKRFWDKKMTSLLCAALVLSLVLAGCGSGSSGGGDGAGSAQTTAAAASSAEETSAAGTEGASGAAAAAEPSSAPEKETAAAASESGEGESGKEETSAAARQPGENGMYMTQAERLGTCTDTELKRFDNFADFMEIAEPFAIIPGVNERIVPQGMDQSDETGRIYISGYFKRDEDNPFTAEGNPTTVAVLDADGRFVAEYTMYNPDGSPFTSHMGGVAVSADTLYVSGNQESDASGKKTYWVAAVPLEGLAAEGHQDVTVEQLYRVPVQPSFMNYSHDTLWIGNFYLATNNSYAPPEEIGKVKTENDGESFAAYILGYDLTGSGPAGLEPADGETMAMPDEDKFYGITNRIQGMSMTEDGRIILSRSYGRNNYSELLGYDPSKAATQTVRIGDREFNCTMLEASTCQTFSYTLMPASEGITVRSGGEGPELLILFESGSVVFDGDGTYDSETGKFRTDYVWKAKLPEK